MFHKPVHDETWDKMPSLVRILTVTPSQDIKVIIHPYFKYSHATGQDTDNLDSNANASYPRLTVSFWNLTTV